MFLCYLARRLGWMKSGSPRESDMSRKNPTDEMAESIGCLVFMLLWTGIVGLFTFIFKASQTSPEERLRKLQPGYAWFLPIEAIDCFQCRAVNESCVSHCYRCGAVLAVPAPVTEPSPILNNNEAAIGLTIMGVFFLVLIVMSMVVR